MYPKPCTVWPLLPLRPLLLFFWILLFQAYGLPVAPHPQCLPALFHHSFPGSALPSECTTFSGPLAASQGTFTNGMGSPDLLNHSTRVSALDSGAAATCYRNPLHSPTYPMVFIPPSTVKATQHHPMSLSCPLLCFLFLHDTFCSSS